MDKEPHRQSVALETPNKWQGQRDTGTDLLALEMV